MSENTVQIEGYKLSSSANKLCIFILLVVVVVNCLALFELEHRPFTLLINFIGVLTVLVSNAPKMKIWVNKNQPG